MIVSDAQSQWNPQNFNESSANEFSPLEALRHQLKTLDELEEQFPVSSVTDAYLRYPFSDSGCSKKNDIKNIVGACYVMVF